MKQILFISDLHLDDQWPETTTLFLKFLKSYAPQAEALYILGDLFEAWIGDDEQTSLQQEIAEALSEVAKQKPVYFIHGNRDFLIKKRYAAQSGLTLMQDCTVINLYGRRALLMHGDTLCTDDLNYQSFRKKVRNRINQALFLTLPLMVRKKIANTLRTKSREYTQATPLTIMDVNKKAVKRAIQNTHVNLLIHGHTHRPAIHHAQTYTRIVLPDWHERNGGVLIYTSDGKYRLQKFTQHAL